MFLSSRVNTPIDHNVFHNLRACACCEMLRILCELGLNCHGMGDRRDSVWCDDQGGTLSDAVKVGVGSVSIFVCTWMSHSFGGGGWVVLNWKDIAPAV